jgi:phosphonatase-like hydrolase
MPIELVVLDLAGTTVRDDDAVNVCLRAALAQGGVPVTREAVNAVMGRPKPLAIRTLVEQEEGEAAGADARRIEALHADFMRRMIDHYRLHPDVREISPAGAVFATLRSRGIKVALDTGFNRPIAEAIFTRLGWSVPAVLDATVTSDEVARGRPHPDLIFRAMELTGVAQAGAVAKVGDTPSDLEEGQAAGCGLVIGVTEGTHTAEQLRVHPHTHLIPNVGHLPALLGQ